MRLDLSTLVYDLPQDIIRLKYAGDFDRLKAALDARIENPKILPSLRRRLILERQLLPLWEKRYIYTYEQALDLMRKKVKDFTKEEFDFYETQGDMEFIYVNREKRYLRSFANALCKMHPELEARQSEHQTSDDGWTVHGFMETVKQKGEAGCRFTLKSSFRVKDDCFEPGSTYMIHFPIPAPSAQQAADKIEIQTDGTAASPSAFQRTVYWQEKLNENRDFDCVMSWENRIRYVDPMKDAPHIVYPDALPPCEDDLAELYPHIVFSPLLRDLAKEIAGDEKRPLYLARRVYDYITLNIRYSYMRSYILIDRHAEYAALNLKGDCGIQALLFITLCRILGVPARWQSGLCVDAAGTGEHDWAQFYTEEFGWLFADPSYGGAGTRQCDEEKRQFYFGNLDPCRMIANRRYQSEYELPKQFENFDPYDNQDGEAETENRGLDTLEYHKEDTVIKFEKF